MGLHPTWKADQNILLGLGEQEISSLGLSGGNDFHPPDLDLREAPLRASHVEENGKYLGVCDVSSRRRPTEVLRGSEQVSSQDYECDNEH